MRLLFHKRLRQGKTVELTPLYEGQTGLIPCLVYAPQKRVHSHRGRAWVAQPGEPVGCSLPRLSFPSSELSDKREEEERNISFFSIWQRVTRRCKVQVSGFFFFFFLRKKKKKPKTHKLTCKWFHCYRCPWGIKMQIFTLVRSVRTAPSRVFFSHR